MKIFGQRSIPTIIAITTATTATTATATSATKSIIAAITITIVPVAAANRARYGTIVPRHPASSRATGTLAASAACVGGLVRCSVVAPHVCRRILVHRQWAAVANALSNGIIIIITVVAAGSCVTV